MARPSGMTGGMVAALLLAASAAVAQDVPVPSACVRDGEGARSTGAALVGRVSDATSGVVLGGSRVTVSWDGGLSGATSTMDGAYTVCDLPRGTPLRVTVEWLGRPGPAVTVSVPAGTGAVVRDLVVGTASPSRLTGRVVGFGTDAPVPAADVRVRRVAEPGASGGRSVSTDGGGGFVVDDAPPAPWVVEVTALGYDAVWDTVDAPPGRSVHVTVRLPEEPLQVDGVLVEVEARIPRLEEAGYYERRREGLGLHLDADHIRPRLPVPVVQLFDGVPGVRVGSTVGQAGSREVLLIGNCLPTIFLDGVLVRRSRPFERNPNPQAGGSGARARDTSPVYLSDLVGAQQIAGIEVFRSPAELPVQYGGTALRAATAGPGEPGGFCGVVLVWTH